MFHLNQQETGLTLIELLMVLLISSLIISGLFTVYLNAKEHHIKNNALQEIAEEMGFVHLLLEQGIWGTGYLGYSNWNKIAVYDNVQKITLESSMIIRDAQDSGLPENVQKKIKPTTQAIELRQMNFFLTSLVGKTDEGLSTIVVEDALDWKNDDELLIADNIHAEINRIVSIKKLSTGKKSIELSRPLYYSYDQNSYVGNYLDRIYFIGNTGHQFPDKTPIYGLYVFDENGITEEITDLVSDIHYVFDKGLLKISIQFTLPYWVEGKIFSRNKEFFIAPRE